MKLRRVLVSALVLPAVVVTAAGCTGASGSFGAASRSSAPADVPDHPAPTVALAGSAEARELSVLPAGPARGTTVLAYSGVGQIRSGFSGQCSHAGESTRVDGTADTAHITIDVTPSGAQVVMKDVGLSATSQLSAGHYHASGRHLSLDAKLAHNGQPTGSIRLEVDCGG